MVALRLALLLAFLGLLGLVVVVLVDFGRSGQKRAADQAEGLDASALDDAEFKSRGTVFRQAVQQGGQTWMIAGDTYQIDRDDNVYLQGVEIELERQDGTYQIGASEGWFNRRTEQAKLENDVTIRGPRGLRLWTDWLELQQGGDVLVASRGTRFAIEGTARGSAETLRADLKRRILALSGGVEVRTEDHIVPGSQLRAERLWMYELSHMVRAEGNVELRQGSQNWLTTRRLTLFLDQANRAVWRVRAMWEVRAGLQVVGGTPTGEPDPVLSASTTTPAPSTEALPQQTPGTLGELLSPGEQVTLSGLRLAVDLDQAGSQPAAFVLAGLVRAPATVSTATISTAIGTGAGGERSRRMTALTVVGSFSQGVLQGADATGGVTLEETWGTGSDETVARSENVARSANGSRRTMTARSAHLEFNSDGEMARLDMSREVRLEEWLQSTGGEDPDMTAVGDLAQFHFVLDRFDLTGSPAATVTNESGTMSAPEFSYDAASGLLHAIGGVRAQFEPGAEGALSAAALNDGDDPVRVEAQEALLRRGSDEFLFKKEVRAWQGRDVLIAEQLRGERVGGRQSLAASGGVKTLWFSNSDESRESDRKEDGDNARSGPMEITAEIFSYLEGASEATMTYEGGVRVLQAGATTTCDLLRVELDTEGEADTMYFEGSFGLDDPEFSRKVEAERAVYQVEAEIIEIFGDPLTIQDDKHNMTGFRAIYRLEDGSLELGVPEPPAAAAPEP